MQQNATLLRKQERFLQALVLGESITDAAKTAKISRSQAHRWLNDPLVQAELERLRTAAREAEEREIERIMTTGYAAVHERVKSLNHIAHEAEKPYTDPDTGRVYQLWNSPDHLHEWRGLLDDIAKETGGRIKQVAKEVRDSESVGEADSLFNKLAAFKQKKQHE